MRLRKNVPILTAVTTAINKAHRSTPLCLVCDIYSNPKSVMRKTNRGLGTASPRGGVAPSTPCSQIIWDGYINRLILDNASSFTASIAIFSQLTLLIGIIHLCHFFSPLSS